MRQAPKHLICASLCIRRFSNPAPPNVSHKLCRLFLFVRLLAARRVRNLTSCSSYPKKELMLHIHYPEGSVGVKADLERLPKMTALVPLSNINLKYSAPKHDVRNCIRKCGKYLAFLIAPWGMSLPVMWKTGRILKLVWT